MDETSTIWYLPNETNQPRGPYSTNQVLEWCRKGEVTPDTLCWCEGMETWQPLQETAPFAEAVRPEAKTDTGEAAGRRIDEIGKVFGRALSATKRKAQATSLKLSMAQHIKKKHKILYQLGNLLYEQDKDHELLQQQSYREIVNQIRQVDRQIEQFHEKIKALGHPSSSSSEDDSFEDVLPAE